MSLSRDVGKIRRTSESSGDLIPHHGRERGLLRRQPVLFVFPLRRAASGSGHLRFHLRQPARDAACRASSRPSANARVPHDKNWFAYKTSEAEPQAFLAEHVGRELGLAFEPADIALTAGAFAAIMVAFHLVLDAGDEAIFSEPAWFCYEPMLLAADAVPRKVALEAADVRPRPRRDRRGDRPADAARHRQHAAQSDRPHLRPRDAGGRSPICSSAPPRGSAAASFCCRTSRTAGCASTGGASSARRASIPGRFISYSYGKVLLAPGQRLGYLAISPLMPDAEREALQRRDVLRADGAGLVLSRMPSCSTPYPISRTSRSIRRRSHAGAIG